MNPSAFPVRMRQFAPLVLVLISAVVAVGAYLQALNYPFVADDTVYVLNNHKLAVRPLNELWRLFLEPYNNSFSEFLPLRDLSYWFDMTLFGLNPAGFRTHNILLYLLCLPLIYGATSGVWRYFRPTDAASAPWAAAAVTALFALHPSHAEAVVWIAGRKDVLAAMFSLLALWLAMRAKREQGISSMHAAAALLALVAAMLSKATAVAVAPVIAMLWLIFWLDMPKPHRPRFLLLWPLASLFLATCVVLIFGAVTTNRIPFYFGIEAAARSLGVLGWLARLAVSPEERHYFYPVFEDPYLPYMVALGVAVLAATMTGGVMILRKRTLEAFALVVFLLLCMPSMQLIPYAPPSLVSDRFLALAVWPAILLIVALSWRLKPVPRMALLLVIALSWGIQTVKHPLDWRSPEALIDTEFQAYPGYYMPAGHKIFDVQLPKGLYADAIETANSIAVPQVRNLMIKLVKADFAVHVDAVSTGNPQKAIGLLWELFLDLKQRPVQANWNSPIHNLWDTTRGLFENQWKYLGKHFPDDALVHYNAGLWMVNVQKYNDAIVHLRAATASQRLPESVRGAAFHNLGLALLASGQIVDAESALLAALKQPQPDMRVNCLLAMIYKQTGRFEEGARAGTKCINAPDQAKAQ